MPDHDVPVLIVGGSLVGMTTAMCLGMHGVPSLVVERHRGSAIHPRAALILQRSMEILRHCGIEDEVQRRSAEQFDQDAAIMAVESLAGEEIAWYLPRLNEGVRDLSPCERLFATQVAIEPVLGERARELGADTRFGTQLESFDDGPDGVTAVLRDRDSGATSTVRARYLIAADGAHSAIRDRLGIGCTGHGILSRSVTIYFRANVKPLLRNRNLGVIMVVNNVLQGFFRIEKPYRSGFLAVHGLGDPKAPNSDIQTGLTDQRCVELVRAGLGDPDIAVEIDDVMKWQATAEVADCWRSGNVFLAGDAAHSMPPYGGYGGNTGIHDAHNLAWKLAAVLDGAAAPDLLDSYEIERRPVAAFTVEQAYARYVARAAPSLAAKGTAPTVPDAMIDLGYRYPSLADGDPAGHGDPREAVAALGSRAPHYPLHRNGNPVSTLDLFGTRFVLLCPQGGQAWQAAAAGLDTDIDVYTVGDPGGLADPDGGFAAAYGIGPKGAVLVRPDGFVAWRCEDDISASGATLGSALRAALGLKAPVAALTVDNKE